MHPCRAFQLCQLQSHLQEAVVDLVPPPLQQLLSLLLPQVAVQRLLRSSSPQRLLRLSSPQRLLQSSSPQRLRLLRSLSQLLQAVAANPLRLLDQQRPLGKLSHRDRQKCAEIRKRLVHRPQQEAALLSALFRQVHQLGTQPLQQRRSNLRRRGPKEEGAVDPIPLN